jgi:hypothetical protein
MCVASATFQQRQGDVVCIRIGAWTAQRQARAQGCATALPGAVHRKCMHIEAPLEKKGTKPDTATPVPDECCMHIAMLLLEIARASRRMECDRVMRGHN